MSVLIVDRANAESLDGGVPGQNATITIGKPSGTSNGDVLVAVLITLDNNNYSSVPTGWTLLTRYTTGSETDRGIHVYYKVITNAAGEPTTYSWQQPGSELQQGCIYNLRGVYTADPIDTYSATHDTDTSGNVSCPGLTTTYNNAFILNAGMVAELRGGHVSGTWSPPSGITKDLDLGSVGYDFVSQTLFIHGFTGHKTLATAGSDGAWHWPNIYDSNVDDIGMSIAFHSNDDHPGAGGGGGGGGCTCNAICNNDCASNQLCTGNVPACVNSFTFTSISTGDIVRASHVLELQTAIDSERGDGGRRFNASDPAHCTAHTGVACSTNEFGGYSWTAGVGVGNIIDAQHFDDVKDANNEVVFQSTYGTAVTNNFVSGAIIYASYITDLQTKINQTRNACICDTHCNCNPGDCGCNGECPSDDYYYYYYYP
jgi:hypothetical protein